MDELLQMPASIGQGILSPTQPASKLGPEKMTALEQMDDLRSLKAQAPPSMLSQGICGQDTVSFIRGCTPDLEHAKEVLEASRWHLLACFQELTKYVHSERSSRHRFQFELSLGGWH